MTHKEKTLIELTCDTKDCKLSLFVENYCRPTSWTFITLQDNKHLEPITKHFCPKCSSQLNFSFMFK